MINDDNFLNRQCFQIGEFFLDPSNRLLKHGDALVSLSPKAFDALLYLVRNPGRLLTRDELIRALWPDSFVEEGNLSVHIFQVRRALGAGADGKAYIQTVPKKGYRFNAEVEVTDRPLNGLARAALDRGDVSSALAPVGEMGANGAALCRVAAAKLVRLERNRRPAWASSQRLDCRPKSPVESVHVLGRYLPEVLPA